MRWLLLCSLLIPSVARAGERCGPNTCSEDEICCNYGCGTCIPKKGDQACVDLACEWGAPWTIEPGDTPRPDDIYDRESVSGGESDLSPDVVATIQRYVGSGAGLRIVGGYDGHGAIGGAGGTLMIPSRALYAAATFDALVDSSGGRALVGLAAATRWPIFQIFAHARWVHEFAEVPGTTSGITGGIDTGGGMSLRAPYLLPCGSGCTRPLPFALSVAYRYRRQLINGDAQTHELLAGLYWIGTRVDVGVETEATIDGPLAFLLRLDYYPNAGR
jgi:hypothetical protein